MLTREEIEVQLRLLEGALVPHRITRREAEALLVERLSKALLIKPDDVSVLWENGGLTVIIPTRLHYHEHLDLIHERVDEIAGRVVFDFGVQTETEHRDTMRRLRKL